MVVNYDHNFRFIVLATINTIVNYNCEPFIVQPTGNGIQKTSNTTSVKANFNLNFVIQGNNCFVKYRGI
jgi:hypothetical protein